VNERIKQLRKYLRITQAAFGAQLGIKANTVTNYETGLRMPSEAIITSICREFNVNEAWLRHGEPPMIIQQSRGEEIAAMVSKVMFDQDDSFKGRFIAALAKFGDKEWTALETVVEALKKDLD